MDYVQPPAALLMPPTERGSSNVELEECLTRLTWNASHVKSCLTAWIRDPNTDNNIVAKNMLMAMWGQVDTMQHLAEGLKEIIQAEA